MLVIIRKTEAAITVYFAKQLLLQFFVNQEKLLAVSGKCMKNFSEQVHFSDSYFSGIFSRILSRFYAITFIHFRFPGACLFRTPLFLTPSC